MLVGASAVSSLNVLMADAGLQPVSVGPSIGEEQRDEMNVRVDGMEHAFLAVVALGLAAVCPDGLGVVDGDGKGDWGSDVLGIGGDKAGEEAAVEGLTGICEARLDDRVVLWFLSVRGPSPAEEAGVAWVPEPRGICTFEKNLYVTVSPTSASIDSGSNLSFPPSPTVTWCSRAWAMAARRGRGRRDHDEDHMVREMTAAAYDKAWPAAGERWEKADVVKRQHAWRRTLASWGGGGRLISRGRVPGAW